MAAKEKKTAFFTNDNRILSCPPFDDGSNPPPDTPDTNTDNTGTGTGGPGGGPGGPGGGDAYTDTNTETENGGRRILAVQKVS